MRPPLTTGALTIGMPRSLLPDVAAGPGVHAAQHAEAGGDENLAVVIGDAAAHALRRVDGVGLAEQAPQGRHVGAVLGRQPLVPDRMAVAGAEGPDMGLRIQGIDQAAAHHRRGGQMGSRCRCPCRRPGSRSGAAVPAPPGDTWRWRHSRRVAASPDCDRAAAAAPACAARVASTFSSLSSDITGMRTPRRLDFLPLEENQLPTSSNTEQPDSSSEAAASTRQKRATRDFILFRRRAWACGRGLRRGRGGGGARTAAAAAWARHRPARCHRRRRRHS